MNQAISEQKNALYALLKSLDFPPNRFNKIFSSISKYQKILLLNDKANDLALSQNDVFDELLKIIGDDLD